MLPLRDQIHLELRKYVDPEIYQEWLNTPNIALDMETPNAVIARGDRTGNYQTMWTFINKIGPRTV